MILHSRDGKVIGELTAEGVFTKNVNGQLHMLRRPPAWAMDADAYDKCIKTGAHTIIIQDTHAHLTYRVSIAVFDAKKGTLNRRFGKQYYLPLNVWQVSSASQEKLSL